MGRTYECACQPKECQLLCLLYRIGIHLDFTGDHVSTCCEKAQHTLETH